MSNLILYGIIGAVSAVLAGLLTQRRNAQLAPLIAEKLRASADGLTVPQLQEALAMKGFSARGKVIMALGEMANTGHVETIDAPAGTPQLEKINVIRYRMRA